MAKKKEIEKEIETKEESKLSFADIKKKTLKYIKKNKEVIIRGTISFVIALLVIVVGIAAIDAIKENSLDNIDYPLVYRKENGEIILLESEDKKGKDGYVLSTSDGTGYTTYGKTSNRYVLTKKENDLYIYDTKKEDKPSKITDDVSNYYFSDNDSYVILTDSDGDMYSYDYKTAKKMIDGRVATILDYSDKAVIYERESRLMYSSLNPKKDDRKELVKKYEIAEFSKDGKSVLYTNSNHVLYRYDIRKDKHTKIGENVDRFYCDDKSCKKLYFTSSEVSYVLYYYDGKKANVVEENIYDILHVNTEKQMVFLTKVEDNGIRIYYKNGMKKAYQFGSEFNLGCSLKVLEENIYLLTAKKDLMYAKINGSKIGKLKKVDTEVEGSLLDYKGGIYYAKNGNDNEESTFYIMVNGKKTKIADDIKETKITVSNNGEKIYYINNIDDNKGTLNVFDGKINKKIAENVYKLLYIRDDMVYYITNYDVDGRHGELYRYDGKSTKIEDKVSDLSSTPNSYIVK